MSNWFFLRNLSSIYNVIVMYCKSTRQRVALRALPSKSPAQFRLLLRVFWALFSARVFDIVLRYIHNYIVLHFRTNPTRIGGVVLQ